MEQINVNINDFIMFEGIGAFNAKWAASKTFPEFYDHEKHTGLSKEQLKEIWTVCCDAQKQKNQK